MHILGISGSLRAASTNTALLRATRAHLPEGPTFSILPWRDVPLYDEDHESPPAVLAVREEVRAADALIIATPEYNHGVPGGLKNLLDQLSRPAFQSVLSGKPCGLLSASPSAVGGARAQQQLRAVLASVNAPVYPANEVLVGNSSTRFTDGELTDERTLSFLQAWLAGFTTWATRIRA